MSVRTIGNLKVSFPFPHPSIVNLNDCRDGKGEYSVPLFKIHLNVEQGDKNGPKGSGPAGNRAEEFDIPPLRVEIYNPVKLIEKFFIPADGLCLAMHPERLRIYWENFDEELIYEDEWENLRLNSVWKKIQSRYPGYSRVLKPDPVEFTTSLKVALHNYTDYDLNKPRKPQVHLLNGRNYRVFFSSGKGFLEKRIKPPGKFDIFSSGNDDEFGPFTEFLLDPMILHNLKQLKELKSVTLNTEGKPEASIKFNEGIITLWDKKDMLTTLTQYDTHFILRGMEQEIEDLI